MRTTHFLVVLLMVSLSGCSTAHRKVPREPELAIYHVKRGAEKELERVLSRTWDAYRSEGLVFSEPHVLVRTSEDSDHNRFVEVFLWRGYHAVEYPSERVKALWAQIESLCEPRSGHVAVEFRAGRCSHHESSNQYNDVQQPAWS